MLARLRAGSWYSLPYPVPSGSRQVSASAGSPREKAVGMGWGLWSVCGWVFLHVGIGSPLWKWHDPSLWAWMRWRKYSPTWHSHHLFEMDEIQVEISTLKIPYEHSLVPIYPDLTFNKDDACFLFETLSSFAFLICKFFLLSGYSFSCVDSTSPSTGVPATWAVASIFLFRLEKLHHPRMLKPTNRRSFVTRF